MYVPMDYHILFLAMSFILFIITMFLIFVDTTMEKAVAAVIFTMVNLLLTVICGYVFSAVDIYGYDSAGAVVHNVQASMYPFTYIYLVLGYVNICLLIYCGYIFVRKPWIERMENDQIQYPGEIY